jgi:predicted glycosyltransferase
MQSAALPLGSAFYGLRQGLGLAQFQALYAYLGVARRDVALSAAARRIALLALLVRLKPLVHFLVQNWQYPRVTKELGIGSIFRNNLPLP